MNKIKFHHIYKEHQEDWQKLIDAYEGAGGFKNGGYLQRHEKESDMKYINRQAMAKYFNFAELIVNTFRDSALREKPARTIESSKLKEILNNTDFNGKNLDTFIREQLTLALIFGFVDTIVDCPNDSGRSILSHRDEIDSERRPYLVSIPPNRVVNWEYDDRGLNAVLLRENHSEDTIFSDESSEQSGVFYRYFDRNRWLLLNSDAEVVEQGEHNLGAVPMIRLYHKKSLVNPFIGKSLLPDPKILIDYYNLDSEKREIFRQQTFSLLLISLGENSSREDIQNLMLAGTNNALALPYGANAKFISPDPDQARLLIEEQKQILRTIFRLKHLKYDTDSNSSKSGEAFRWDYKDMHQILSGIASNLEDYEYNLVRLISKWGQNSDMTKGFTVNYTKDFNIYSLAETLETATKLATLQNGKDIEKIYSKKILIPKLMSLTEDEKNQTFKE